MALPRYTSSDACAGRPPSRRAPRLSGRRDPAREPAAGAATPGGFQHAGEAQIEAVGDEGCVKRAAILRRMTDSQVAEAIGHASPGVDLLEEIGDPAPAAKAHRF